MKYGRTLVIQNLQGIGDTMWFVRHLHVIAQQTEAKSISVLTRPRSMADKILQADPAIDKVLWLDIKKGQHDGFLGTLRLANLIRKNKFDTVWILHSRSLRYAIACKLAGVKNIIGPGHGLQKYLITNKQFLSESEQFEHPIERAGHLLKHQGLSLGSEISPCIVASSAKTFITKKFDKFQRPWIALGIASSESHKKWLWQNFADLGIRLRAETGGKIFIMGGTSETKEAQLIYDEMFKKGYDPVKATDLTIEQSLALIQQCKFIVGNDTGIIHAAPMVGSHGLVLLGKSQVPIHYYSEVEGLRLASSDKVEQPPNNVQDIAVSDVFQKLKSLHWI
jgi:heptosyltransferase-2